MSQRELSPPPPGPVPWTVAIRSNPSRRITVTRRTAFEAIDVATVELKESPAAPCLDRSSLCILR